MLARPSVAKLTVNQIESFVFYSEPYDEQKAELDHRVMCRGKITLINYYICCLAVLPSHILGMSRWISVVDETKNASRTQSGETSRRFRYSYYCGWLHVESYHVCPEISPRRIHELPRVTFALCSCDVSSSSVFCCVWLAIVWHMCRRLFHTPSRVRGDIFSFDTPFDWSRVQMSRIIPPKLHNQNTHYYLYYAKPVS